MGTKPEVTKPKKTKLSLNHEAGAEVVPFNLLKLEAEAEAQMFSGYLKGFICNIMLTFYTPK